VKWTAFFGLINDAGRELNAKWSKEGGRKNAHSLAETKKGVINAATKTGKKSDNLCTIHCYSTPSRNALQKVCNDLESSYYNVQLERLIKFMPIKVNFNLVSDLIKVTD